VSIDDRIAHALRLAAAPPTSEGIWDEVLRRARHRQRRRRTYPVGIAAGVVTVTVVGAYGLLALFGRTPGPVGPLPSNGQLIFEFAGADDSSDLYRADADGRGAQPATLSTSRESSPAWSPDGQRLAFARTSRVDGRLQAGLYVMDADGSDVQEVLILAANQNVRQVQWLPDGPRIAFLTFAWSGDRFQESDLQYGLFLVDPDGSGLVQVPTRGQVVSFSVSPDGRRIAFTRQELVAGDRFATDLFVMDLDGSDESRLTSDGRSMSPAWSPEGGRIAFSSYGPSQPIEEKDIYLIDVDGSGRTQLTVTIQSEDGPSWAPDATQVLFTRFHGPGGCQIVSVTLASGSETVLVSGESLDGCVSTPAWQPIPNP
jgi:Tol biopolymer transport system component